jgi:CBS-domain-containing membrane protein
MAKIYVLSDRPVREFMSTAVVTVGEDDNIEDLVWKFQRYRYAGFPVVNDKGELVGMIRDSDILKLFVMTRPHSILADTAKDVMRVPPQTISPEATAQKAVQDMFDANVRLLVVTDKKKKILGILSREDLVTGIFSKRRTDEWPKA